MEIFIPWVILSILVAVYANNKGRIGILYFILSVLLSPLIGFLIALIISDKTKRKCYNCGQNIDVSAKVCPFCNKQYGNKINTISNANDDFDIDENGIKRYYQNDVRIYEIPFSLVSWEKLKELLIEEYTNKKINDIRINDEKNFMVIQETPENFQPSAKLFPYFNLVKQDTIYKLDIFEIPRPKFIEEFKAKEKLNINDKVEITNTLTNKSNVEQLIELSKLLEKNLITLDDFNNMKDRLLNN